MPVHFVFSDEAGNHKVNRDTRFLLSAPFFIRSGVIVKGDDWPLLRDGFRGLQDHHGFRTSIELKWQYIGSIRAHRSRGEPIPTNRPYYAFSDYSDDALIGFVREAINLLKRYDSCRIVYTVTDNSITEQIAKEKLYRMHLQDLMQRTEFELQVRDGLAVMLLDSQNSDSDRCIRDAYAAIYREGDFIKKYLHITDSLAFALSHHSFGIRLADYTAGIFNGFLREYQISTNLFQNQVWPLLCKNPGGNPFGWGICEVPTNSTVRERIRKRLISAGLLGPDVTEEAMF